ncbi:MAG: hypothetical protein H6709_07750 [Kofleriaceae bacterium]|nr:hypothetical protein [Kofleriaceae bacterium]
MTAQAQGPAAAIVAVAAGALAVAAGAAPAHAQQAVGDRPAVSVERFTPAPGHTFAGVVEDPDVLPRLRWTAALWSTLSARPIVLRDVVTGEDATVPVAWRLGFEAQAAIGLGDRYQLGVAVPWAAQDGDRLQGTGLGDAALKRLVLGDVRLHGRVRVTGAPGDRGLGAALAGAVVLPTGDDDQFAGEAGPVVEWKLALGWRDDRVALAGNLGVRLRTEEVVLLSPARPHGNEIAGGLAGEVALPWLGRAVGLGGPGARAWAVGEVVGVVGDSIGAGARGASPGEVRGGLRLAVADGWAVTLIAGAGVTPDDVGSPAWRLVAGVTHDRAPTSDRDRDGVIDGRDRCRDVAEDRDGFEDDDGCPDDDDDGDGIPDALDRCPRDAEDRDGFDDEDGCPDAEIRVPPRPDPALEPRWER